MSCAQQALPNVTRVAGSQGLQRPFDTSKREVLLLLLFTKRSFIIKKKFILLQEKVQQEVEKLSDSYMAEIKFAKGKGNWRGRNSESAAVIPAAPSSSSSKGGRVSPPHGARALGKPPGVCVLRGRHTGSPVFPNTKLRICQEHEPSQMDHSLRSEEGRETASVLLT